MRRLNGFRHGWCLTLLLLAWSAMPAQAQVVTVTLQGIDGWLDAARYGLTMAGQEDQAKQLDGLLQAFLQGEGFKGIDTKKPLGAYVDKFPANPDKPPVVGFIPVTKEQDFLDFLSRLNITASREEKGVRSIEIPTGQRIYLRFSDGYVFVADDEANLKTLLKPAGLTKSVPSTALLHVKFNLDQIPDNLKKMVIAHMDAELAKKKDRQEGEKDEEYQGRLMGMKLAHEFFGHVIDDSKALSAALSLDKTKHLFLFDVGLQAKPGSMLHEEIRQMNQSKTAFATLLQSSSASVVSHGIVNETLRGEINKLIDTAFNSALAKEKSVVKRALAEKVFKVLEPTLKSNVYDLAAALHGGQGDQPLTGILALRVKNGKQVEQLVRDLVEEMKGKEREHFKLDADKVGDVNLHIIDVPVADEKGKDAEKIFGALKITIGFHDEAIIVALGKQSTDEVKTAVKNFGKSTDAQPAPLQIELHGKAFTRFEQNAEKRKAFEEALSEPGSDLIRVSVAGGDDLSFRIQVSSHFLKLAKALKEKGE